jgi:hypothetical protein
MVRAATMVRRAAVLRTVAVTAMVPSASSREVVVKRPRDEMRLLGWVMAARDRVLGDTLTGGPQ